MTSKKVLGALSLAAVLGVAGIAMTGVHAAETAQVTYQATLSNSLSISADAATKSVTLTNGGAPASAETTLTYNTNAAGGAVILAASTTNTNLTSGTNTIPYSTSELSTGTSGWNLTANSNIIDLDTEGATVLDSISATASTTLPVTFKAAADADQPAGTYTNQVTYTIQAQ